jgi:hypothetical protein
MLLSCYQNAGQSDIKIANRSFENVVQFRYLGTRVTDQNLIQKEIKRRLNSGNACYHSVQNLLSSHLLYKNMKHPLTWARCTDARAGFLVDWFVLSYGLQCDLMGLFVFFRSGENRQKINSGFCYLQNFLPF